MSWRRRLIYALLALLVIGLLAWGFVPGAMLVETAEVRPGPVAATVEEEGQTRVADRYVVSAPITAQARRITLQEGDRVAEGDLLVTLDPPVAPALDPRQVAEARARVAAAESTLEAVREEAQAANAMAQFAATELLRVQRMAERELVSPEQADRAAAEAQRTAAMAQSARFRVQVAESELAAARAALEHIGAANEDDGEGIELRSPVDGQVLERHFESARVVRPGEPILEVGDPAALEIVVDVLSADAVRLEPGTFARLERWGDEPLEARVRRVEPSAFTKISALGVEEQRVPVILDITSAPGEWARLGDAYRVNARFFLAERDNVVRVANSALFRVNDGWGVFVVENGRAHQQPVTTGLRGDRYTEILEGLAEGETIILYPARELADGTRVRPR